MRSRRALSLCASATLLAAAACNAIAGLDGDFTVDADAGGNGSTTSSSSSSTSSGSNSSTSSSSSSSSTGGPPDTGPPPVDARAAFDAALPTVLSAPPTTCPGILPSGSTRFCYDFKNTTNPRTEWNENVRSDGGDFTLNDGGLGLPARAIIASGGEARMTWKTWDKDAAAPLTIAEEQTITLTFVMTLHASARQAVIGALRFDQARYGLALYPGACGFGVDCLAANDAPSADLQASGTRFEMDKRYAVEVQVKRSAGAWSGTIKVGGRVVSTQNAVFGASAGTTPLAIDLGVIDPQGSGSTVVELDDVYLNLDPILPQDAGAP